MRNTDNTWRELISRSIILARTCFVQKTLLVFSATL